MEWLKGQLKLLSRPALTFSNLWTLELHMCHLGLLGQGLQVATVWRILLVPRTVFNPQEFSGYEESSHVSTSCCVHSVPSSTFTLSPQYPTFPIWGQAMVRKLEAQVEDPQLYRSQNQWRTPAHSSQPTALSASASGTGSVGQQWPFKALGPFWLFFLEHTLNIYSQAWANSFIL